jgi:hypothetical protein
MEDKRPVYVRDIDRARRQAETEVLHLVEGIHELRGYLNSAKFREGRGPLKGYVNVDDVLLRLAETELGALDAASTT